jgi:hypothetical protein
MILGMKKPFKISWRALLFDSRVDPEPGLLNTYQARRWRCNESDRNLDYLTDGYFSLPDNRFDLGPSISWMRPTELGLIEPNFRVKYENAMIGITKPMIMANPRVVMTMPR